MGVRRMLGFRMRFSPANTPSPPPLFQLSRRAWHPLAQHDDARRWYKCCSPPVRCGSRPYVSCTRLPRTANLFPTHPSSPTPHFSNFEISVHTMMQLTEGTQCFQVKAPTLAQEKRAQESMWNDGGCYAFVIGVKRSMQHEKWPVTIVGRAQLVFLDSSQASVRWGRGGSRQATRIRESHRPKLTFPPGASVHPHIAAAQGPPGTGEGGCDHAPQSGSDHATQAVC